MTEQTQVQGPLVPGTRVRVVGYRPAVRAEPLPAFFGHVVSVFPSGTVLLDREDARDGAGTPIRLYVSNGSVLPAGGAS